SAGRSCAVRGRGAVPGGSARGPPPAHRRLRPNPRSAFPHEPLVFLLARCCRARRRVARAGGGTPLNKQRVDRAIVFGALARPSDPLERPARIASQGGAPEGIAV